MTYEARKILYGTGAGFPQTMVVGWDETAAMPYALKVDQFGRLSAITTSGMRAGCNGFPLK